MKLITTFMTLAMLALHTYADPASPTQTIQGAWDVLSERSGGQAVEPRVHRVWHISPDSILLNGNRTLYFKAGTPTGTSGRFQIVNRVGTREITVYSCLFEMGSDGNTMRVALNAGDEFPPGFTEDPNSWHFILTMRKRN